MANIRNGVGEWRKSGCPPETAKVTETSAAKHWRPIDYSHLRGASEPEMAAAMNELSWRPWYHCMDLPHGLVTPGVHRCEEFWQLTGMAKYVHGKSVLDIGANDGGYSFLCEREGAANVVAADIDNHLEMDLGDGPFRARVLNLYKHARAGGVEEEWRFLNRYRFGFAFASACRESRIERIHASAYDLCPERFGAFDVTLFLGVVYHLLDPIGALRRVRSVTRGVTIVESEVSLDDGLPDHACAFYRGGYLGDDSNWFVPTPGCLMDWVLTAGYAKARFIGATGGRVWIEARV